MLYRYLELHEYESNFHFTIENKGVNVILTRLDTKQLNDLQFHQWEQLLAPLFVK
jgi:hypothetical protein